MNTTRSADRCHAGNSWSVFTRHKKKFDYYAVRLLFISIIHIFMNWLKNPLTLLSVQITFAWFQCRFECAVRHNCIIIVVTNTCPDFIIRGDKLHPQGLSNRSFSTGFWLESDVISQILDIYWPGTSVFSNFGEQIYSILLWSQTVNGRILYIRLFQ